MPQVCPDQGGAAVPRRVGEYERERAIECVDDRSPGVGRLGEAVQQDEGWLRAPGCLVDVAGRQRPVLSVWMILALGMLLALWMLLALKMISNPPVVLGHPVILDHRVTGCHPTVRRQEAGAVSRVAAHTLADWSGAVVTAAPAVPRPGLGSHDWAPMTGLP